MDNWVTEQLTSSPNTKWHPNDVLLFMSTQRWCYYCNHIFLHVDKNLSVTYYSISIKCVVLKRFDKKFGQNLAIKRNYFKNALLQCHIARLLGTSKSSNFFTELENGGWTWVKLFCTVKLYLCFYILYSVLIINIEFKTSHFIASYLVELLEYNHVKFNTSKINLSLWIELESLFGSMVSTAARKVRDPGLEFLSRFNNCFH